MTMTRYVTFRCEKCEKRMPNNARNIFGSSKQMRTHLKKVHHQYGYIQQTAKGVVLLDEHGNARLTDVTRIYTDDSKVIVLK